MRHSQLAVRALVISLVCLALTGCGDDTTDNSEAAPAEGSTSTTAASDTDETSPPDLSEVTLRVGVTAPMSGYERALHDASGVFDDLPYEVEWVEFETTRDGVEALNAGAIDVAASMHATNSILAMGNASEPWTIETAPYVAVGADLPSGDTGFNLLVPVDSDVESITDLVGKRVAFTPGALGHYFFVRLVGDAGLTTADIEQVQLPPSEGRAAFTGGSVDAIIAGYNASLGFLDAGTARIVVSSQSLIDEYTLTLVSRELLEDPAVEAAVGDLLQRLEESNAWTVDNVDVVEGIFETVGGLEPDAAQVAAKTVAKRRVAIDDVVDAALQDQADAFLGEGVIENEIDVSVLLDDRYNESVPAG